MAKKKLLSAALAGGLAATGADAVDVKSVTSDSEIDIITVAEEDFSGDILITLDDDWDALITGTPEADVDDEMRIDYAQTFWGGTPDSISGGKRPRGNITLDNGIRKPKGITLDNGLKRGNRLKPKGNSRKLRGGKRKRRN